MVFPLSMFLSSATDTIQVVQKLKSGKFFLFGFIKKEFLGEKVEITEALYKYLSDKLQDMTFPLLHEYISTNTIKYDMFNFIEDFRKKFQRVSKFFSIFTVIWIQGLMLS